MLSAPSYISQRLDHSFKVKFTLCKTTYFLEHFVLRVSKLWNELRYECALLINPVYFKQVVSNLLGIS